MMKRGRTASPSDLPSLGDRVRIGVVATIGPMVLRLLGATWRVQIIGGDVVDAVHESGRQIVFAFWHCHILPLVHMYRGCGVAVLSSWHRDGEISARAMKSLGFNVERGSTSRGSVQGLMRMVRRVRGGNDLAMTRGRPVRGRGVPGRESWSSDRPSGCRRRSISRAFELGSFRHPVPVLAHRRAVRGAD